MQDANNKASTLWRLFRTRQNEVASYKLYFRSVNNGNFRASEYPMCLAIVRFMRH